MYQIEDLLDWYFGDRARFPRDVTVSNVPVEVDYEGKLRLKRDLPERAKPDLSGAAVTSERLTFKEYEVADTVIVFAAYSDKAKRLFIGEWEP